MGLLANVVNSTQFRVSLKDGQTITDVPFPGQRLLQHAFQSIDNMAVEQSIGWVSLFDHADTKFEGATTHIGDYVTFSMRQDKRKVPAALLREKVETACKLFLTENPGYTKVPKLQRIEITDQAREILLARSLPSPATFDVSWHLPTNVITFYHLSTKATENFYDLFRKTFPELGLKLITPYDRGIALLNGDMHNTGDTSPLAMLITANKATGTSVLELIKENEWIGTDFFSWLLFATSNALITADQFGADTCGACWIDHKISLVCGGENAQKIAFTGDQSKLKEVKTALSEGKRVSEARIFMQVDDAEWSLNLKGGTFDFASYRCPSVKIEYVEDDALEYQAVFLERQFLLEKGREHFNSIFAAFLKVRLSERWGEVLPQIEEWWREA